MILSTVNTRATVRCRAAIWIACILAVASCDSNNRSAGETGQSKETVFEDMAQSSGLDFIHYSGATGKYYFPEILGAGIALLDYDGDDDLDVFVLQGGQLDPAAGGNGMVAGLPPGPN